MERGYVAEGLKYQKGEMSMNAAISSVIRNQASNSASAGKIESETIKSAEEVSGGQNTAVESSVSSKYDTLDLSQEYLEYKTQSQNGAVQDQTSQLNSTMLRPPVTAGNKDVVYNYQLYSYTETELLEMMSDGTISRREYEEEMTGRESSFAADLLMRSYN